RLRAQGRVHPGHTQFGSANYPNLHLFGLWEETGVPGGLRGRTCKLHTHTDP
ncbi:Ribosomal RNA small subunit methyltransferase H, partial [Clarias magur]